MNPRLFQRIHSLETRNEFLENIIYSLTTGKEKLSLNMYHEIESIIASKNRLYFEDRNFYPLKSAKKQYADADHKYAKYV